MYELPTPDDFAKHAAVIQLGCADEVGVLNVRASRILDAPNGSQFAIGLGLVSHVSHDHLLLIQLEKSRSEDWHLQSDAHTDIQHGRSNTVVWLDMRSCGTFSVAAQLGPSAHTLRLALGSLREETNVVGGVALITASAIPDGNTPRVDVLDVHGDVIGSVPDATGFLEMGISYRGIV